jgi:GWxTD domain-containing protein
LRAAPVAAVWLSAAIIAVVCGRQSHAGVHPPLSNDEVRKRAEKLPADLTYEIAAMQYVLTPLELADLLEDTDEARCRAWIDAWWDARDPIPTNAENEARDEHERRRLNAQAHFGRGRWPGWDDRGEVFIRYGNPAVRDEIGADVLPPGVFIPAEELWYYPQFHVYARFHDTGFNGFAQFLEQVETPLAERPRSDRRNLASEYNPDLPMDYMDVDMTLADAMFLYPPLADAAWDNFLQQVHGYYDLEDLMPAVYPFDMPEMQLPAYMAVHSFRGGAGVDRVDVSTEFESSARPLSAGSTCRRFITTSVFWDRRGVVIARHSRADSIATDALVTQPVAGVVNQITLTLPPGTYRMAVTVEEEGSGRFASTRREVICHGMNEELAMSDLALARSIKPAREGSPFNRGAIEVVPRPSAKYRIGQPLPVYFELYRVPADHRGKHSYSVEYTIKPRVERRRSLWSRLIGRGEDPVQVSSSFRAVSNSADDFVQFTAGTKNLPAGEYVLAVEVTDGAELRRVTRETTFSLLK